VPDALLKPLLQRLPARAQEDALIAAARKTYCVPASVGIVAAPGTQALIQWLPRLALPGSVAIAVPTYSEHARAWSDAEHTVLPMDTIDALPGEACHALIVNPNNPDGRVASLAAIQRMAKAVRERGGWLVLDEAFVDVMPEATAANLCAELPLVILRSFGKFYGLAGLRLGFAIAAPAIIEQVRKALGPWPVSGPALAIGAAALRDADWAGGMRGQLALQADRLDAILATTGGTVVGGTSLFRLLRHADATSIHERLARQQIWCRKFTHADDLLRFGLPGSDQGFARLAHALTPPPRER